MWLWSQELRDLCRMKSNLNKRETKVWTCRPVPDLCRTLEEQQCLSKMQTQLCQARQASRRM